MKTKAINKIRSAGVRKINELVRAARHLNELRPAFAEWNVGEIFVCKKTGAYRYRFGKRCKMVTPWNDVAQRVFSSPAAFAFAAAVLGGTLRSCITRADQIEREMEKAAALPQGSAGRANVIQMANAA